MRLLYHCCKIIFCKFLASWYNNCLYVYAIYRLLIILISPKNLFIQTGISVIMTTWNFKICIKCRFFRMKSFRKIAFFFDKYCKFVLCYWRKNNYNTVDVGNKFSDASSYICDRMTAQNKNMNGYNCHQVTCVWSIDLSPLWAHEVITCQYFFLETPFFYGISEKTEYVVFSRVQTLFVIALLVLLVYLILCSIWKNISWQKKCV